MEGVRVHWRMFSTVKDVQYCRVPWGKHIIQYFFKNTFQFCAGYSSSIVKRCHSVQRRMLSTVGISLLLIFQFFISTVYDIQYNRGVTSVLWGDTEGHITKKCTRFLWFKNHSDFFSDFVDFYVIFLLFFCDFCDFFKCTRFFRVICPWGDTIWSLFIHSALADVHYRWGSSIITLGDTTSLLRRMFCTLKAYRQYCGGY